MKKKLLEQVDWDEFDPDEFFGKDPEPIFKPGDRIRPCLTTYWSDEFRLHDSRTGVWKEYKWDKVYTVAAVKECYPALKGYEGTIVKMEGSWPWYQITNMEKV